MTDKVQSKSFYYIDFILSLPKSIPIDKYMVFYSYNSNPTEKIKSKAQIKNEPINIINTPDYVNLPNLPEDTLIYMCEGKLPKLKLKEIVIKIEIKKNDGKSVSKYKTSPIKIKSNLNNFFILNVHFNHCNLLNSKQFLTVNDELNIFYSKILSKNKLDLLKNDFAISLLKYIENYPDKISFKLSLKILYIIIININNYTVINDIYQIKYLIKFFQKINLNSIFVLNKFNNIEDDNVLNESSIVLIEKLLTNYLLNESVKELFISKNIIEKLLYYLIYLYMKYITFDKCYDFIISFDKYKIKNKLFLDKIFEKKDLIILISNIMSSKERKIEKILFYFYDPILFIIDNSYILKHNKNLLNEVISGRDLITYIISNEKSKIIIKNIIKSINLESFNNIKDAIKNLISQLNYSNILGLKEINNYVENCIDERQLIIILINTYNKNTEEIITNNIDLILTELFTNDISTQDCTYLFNFFKEEQKDFNLVKILINYLYFNNNNLIKENDLISKTNNTFNMKILLFNNIVNYISRLNLNETLEIFNMNYIKKMINNIYSFLNKLDNKETNFQFNYAYCFSYNVFIESFFNSNKNELNRYKKLINIKIIYITILTNIIIISRIYLKSYFNFDTNTPNKISLELLKNNDIHYNIYKYNLLNHSKIFNILFSKNSGKSSNEINSTIKEYENILDIIFTLPIMGINFSIMENKNISEIFQLISNDTLPKIKNELFLFVLYSKYCIKIEKYNQIQLNVIINSFYDFLNNYYIFACIREIISIYELFNNDKENKVYNNLIVYFNNIKENNTKSTINDIININNNLIKENNLIKKNINKYSYNVFNVIKNYSNEIKIIVDILELNSLQLDKLNSIFIYFVNNNFYNINYLLNIIQFICEVRDLVVTNDFNIKNNFVNNLLRYFNDKENVITLSNDFEKIKYLLNCQENSHYLKIIKFIFDSILINPSHSIFFEQIAYLLKQTQKETKSNDYQSKEQLFNDLFINYFYDYYINVMNNKSLISNNDIDEKEIKNFITYIIKLNFKKNINKLNIYNLSIDFVNEVNKFLDDKNYEIYLLIEMFIYLTEIDNKNLEKVNIVYKKNIENDDTINSIALFFDHFINNLKENVIDLLKIYSEQVTLYKKFLRNLRNIENYGTILYKKIKKYSNTINNNIFDIKIFTKLLDLYFIDFSKLTQLIPFFEQFKIYINKEDEMIINNENCNQIYLQFIYMNEYFKKDIKNILDNKTDIIKYNKFIIFFSLCKMHKLNNIDYNIKVINYLVSDNEYLPYIFNIISFCFYSFFNNDDNYNKDTFLNFQKQDYYDYFNNHLIENQNSYLYEIIRTSFINYFNLHYNKLKKYNEKNFNEYLDILFNSLYECFVEALNYVNITYLNKTGNNNNLLLIFCLTYIKSYLYEIIDMHYIYNNDKYKELNISFDNYNNKINIVISNNQRSEHVNNNIIKVIQIYIIKQFINKHITALNMKNTIENKLNVFHSLNWDKYKISWINEFNVEENYDNFLKNNFYYDQEKNYEIINYFDSFLSDSNNNIKYNSEIVNSLSMNKLVIILYDYIMNNILSIENSTKYLNLMNSLCNTIIKNTKNINEKTELIFKDILQQSSAHFLKGETNEDKQILVYCLKLFLIVTLNNENNNLFYNLISKNVKKLIQNSYIPFFSLKNQKINTVNEESTNLNEKLEEIKSILNNQDEDTHSPGVYICGCGAYYLIKKEGLPKKISICNYCNNEIGGKENKLARNNYRIFKNEEHKNNVFEYYDFEEGELDYKLLDDLINKKEDKDKINNNNEGSEYKKGILKIDEKNYILKLDLVNNDSISDITCRIFHLIYYSILYFIYFIELIDINEYNNYLPFECVNPNKILKMNWNLIENILQNEYHIDNTFIFINQLYDELLDFLGKNCYNFENFEDTKTFENKFNELIVSLIQSYNKYCVIYNNFEKPKRSVSYYSIIFDADKNFNKSSFPYYNYFLLENFPNLQNIKNNFSKENVNNYPIINYYFKCYDNFNLMKNLIFFNDFNNYFKNMFCHFINENKSISVKHTIENNKAFNNYSSIKKRITEFQEYYNKFLDDNFEQMKNSNNKITNQKIDENCSLSDYLISEENNLSFIYEYLIDLWNGFINNVSFYNSNIEVYNYDNLNQVLPIQYINKFIFLSDKEFLFDNDIILQLGSVEQLFYLYSYKYDLRSNQVENDNEKTEIIRNEEIEFKYYYDDIEELLTRAMLFNKKKFKLSY